MTDYTSTAELGEWLRSIDGADDGELALMITEASRLIDSHCRFSFEPAASSATARLFNAGEHSLNTCDLIWVDPISSTTELVIETRTSLTADWVAWDAADYQLEPLNQRHAGIDNFPYWAIRAVNDKTFPISDAALVRVTARWGWTDGTHPLIQGACKSIVKGMHTQRNAPGDVAVIGEGLATRIYMVSKDAHARLRPFVRPDRPWI